MKDNNIKPLHIFDKDDGMDFQSRAAAIMLLTVFIMNITIVLTIISHCIF